MSDFGTLADETGLGPEELSAKLGISYSTLWRYRTGKIKRLDSGVVDKMRTIHREVVANKATEPALPQGA